MTQDPSHKLWKIIAQCPTTTLITQGLDGFFHARTMETVPVPQAGEIWFATDVKERKVGEIKRQPQVTLFFSQPDKSWASVYGMAEVVTDSGVKSRLWKEDWEKYWPQGPAAEEFVLIRVIPIAADYLLSEGFERGHVLCKSKLPVR